MHLPKYPMGEEAGLCPGLDFPVLQPLLWTLKAEQGAHGQAGLIPRPC